MDATMERKPYYKLKNLIDEKGYNQYEIAQILDMPRTTFSLKINRTNGRDFTFSEAIRIAEILETTVSNFF